MASLILGTGWRHLLTTLLCLYACGCTASLQTPLYPMLQKYEGEDRRTDSPVQYVLDSQALMKMKLRVRDGLLVDDQDQPLDPKIDAHPKRDGFAIFVMDKRGEIYVSFDHEHDVFHHSSFLAGAPVAAAGDMTILDGRLLSVSNSSGHYRPPPVSLQVLLKRLGELGVPTHAIKITTVDEPDRPTTSANPQ